MAVIRSDAFGPTYTRLPSKIQPSFDPSYPNPFDDEPEAPARGTVTDKQIQFLVKLATERGYTHPGVTTYIMTPPGGYAVDFSLMSKAEASKTITDLLNAKPVAKPATPRTITPAPAAKADLECGMYRNPQTGEIFKVQIAVHGSGHPYAKRLVIEGEGTNADVYFEYASGVIRKLKAEWKMTTEEAKAFGALYGTCISCARTLTLEDSIHNGYGKKCASNNGWDYEKAPKINL